MIKRMIHAARQTELARHGSVLFVALTIANLSNYIFHAAISRLLDPADYGALGALLAVFTLVSVPAGAVQVVVAKRVSILRGQGAVDETARLIRSMLAGAVLISTTLGAVVAALSPAVAKFLNLSDVLPAILLACFVTVAVVTPVVRGALQGQMLFTPLAALSAGSTVLRLLSGILFVRLGWGVSGAIGASVVAEVSIIVVGLIPLRDLLSAARGRLPARYLLSEAHLAILAFGGFWAIVSLDTPLVRHYFPPSVSGFYAAAAVAAHMVLFLPGAIAMVAFPKFAESRGQSVEARRTLFHAIVAVAIFGIVGASFLGIFSTFVIKSLFGAEYLSGTIVIGTLSAAMAMLGVVNVLVYFHLSTSSRALWSLGAAIVAESAGIVLFHGSILEVSLTVLVVSAFLLAFNLIAAYAHPGDARVQPAATGALWGAEDPDLDLTVVTPAFNPGSSFRKNLELLLSTLENAGVSYEVIAVSDGSTDGSHLEVSDMSDEAFRLIHYDINRGKGFALRTGLAEANGEYVAFIDSDGDLHPSGLASFVALMKAHDVDLVIGSKRHPLSEVEYPPLRRVMSWSYSLMVRLLFGIRVTDTQTGLKLARRSLLAAVLPRMLEKRFAFDLELMVVAKMLGFNKVLEAPVHLNYQFTSSVSLRNTVAMIIDTLAIFYRRYILRYYSSPVDPRYPNEYSIDKLPVDIAEIP